VRHGVPSTRRAKLHKQEDEEVDDDDDDDDGDVADGNDKVLSKFASHDPQLSLFVAHGVYFITCCPPVPANRPQVTDKQLPANYKLLNAERDSTSLLYASYTFPSYSHFLPDTTQYRDCTRKLTENTWQFSLAHRN